MGIPDSFYGLLENTDLSTKKGMLELLMNRIKQDELSEKQANMGDLVDYFPDFLSEQSDSSLPWGAM